MDFRKYAAWSLAGGILWAGGVTALGYWLGQATVVRNHLELFILGVVVVSLIPIGIEYLRNRRRAGAPARNAERGRTSADRSA